MILTIFCPFWVIFAALRPSFYYFFTIFVMGSEVCLERCDSYGNFGFKNIHIYIFFKENFVTYCNPGSAPLRTGVLEYCTRHDTVGAWGWRISARRYLSFSHISRPGRSRGLLYKHRRHHQWIDWVCPPFLSIRRYGPLCRPTSSSCEGLRPRLLLPFGQNKRYFMLF